LRFYAATRANEIKSNLHLLDALSLFYCGCNLMTDAMRSFIDASTPLNCVCARFQMLTSIFASFIAHPLGSSIERLCDVAASDPTGYAQLDDRGPMVRAARALLGSVTRVLLLADIVVVKQLLLAKDRVSVPRLHAVNLEL
jgi:hypothetical protein